jgi:hypothetical protein
MFSYEQIAVGYLWRYRCAASGAGKCFKGGKVSSALAYSYDSKTFMAFGKQPPSNGTTTAGSHIISSRISTSSSAAVRPQSAVEHEGRPQANGVANGVANGIALRGVQNVTRYMVGIDFPIDTYRHTYKHFDNITAGALACQAECDSDGKCKAWTYVPKSPKESVGECRLHVQQLTQIYTVTNCCLPLSALES